MGQCLLVGECPVTGHKRAKSFRAICLIQVGLAAKTSQTLPPRSTAGQLTLDQHIGVRIPGGQPNLFNQLRSFTCLISGNWQHPAGNICFANTPAQGATSRYPAANSAGAVVGPIDTAGLLPTPWWRALVAFRDREPRIALV